MKMKIIYIVERFIIYIYIYFDGQFVNTMYDNRRGIYNLYLFFLMNIRSVYIRYLNQIYILYI